MLEISKISECLNDIECNKNTVSEFNLSDVSGKIRILKRHRASLMNCVREKQKCVDRVDYLIMQLEKIKD